MEQWLPFVRGLPILVGFIVTIVLGWVLDDNTHKYAVSDNLVEKNKKAGSHLTLDYLLKWRDLVIAAATGVFVLQFAAAELVLSSSKVHVGSGTIPLCVVAFVLTMFLLPIFVAVIWLIANRVKPAHMQNNYWLFFCFVVVPWYILALLFAWSDYLPFVSAK